MHVQEIDGQNILDVAPGEARLRASKSGDGNVKGQQNFFSEDSEMRKYATENSRNGLGGRNGDIGDNEELQYLYRHQPSFSRVSERSQEEDEESFDLKQRRIKKGRLAKSKSSNLRESSVSKSNLSDNSQIGRKSATNVYFNSRTSKRAGRRKPMESQVKVKQSVKRSASVTKQMAADIHKRATERQTKRLNWEQQKKQELDKKEVEPCTFKPDLSKPKISRSISPFDAQKPKSTPNKQQRNTTPTAKATDVYDRLTGW